MIVTDDLLFLHLHKSGGTFVNALLMRCVPSARQIGYHLPYREVPAVYLDRPVLGSVRSPWAYYVSWYHFQLSRPKPNALFRLCSDEGQLGFAETVLRLINLADDKARLSLFRDSLPETFGVSGLNLTKTCADDLGRSGRGFYSFLYERLYSGAADPLIVRVESLRQDLCLAFATLGLLPNACVERFLDEAPPRNVSHHGVPHSYYDPSLAALVADRDRSVIECFGYAFGQDAKGTSRGN